MGHRNPGCYSGSKGVDHPDHGLLFNASTKEMLCISDATHSYYEITGANQGQTASQYPHTVKLRSRDVNGENGEMLEDWTRTKPGSTIRHKAFTSAATLGRPGTGKGRRQTITKGDSLHSSKAGELALYANKKHTITSEVNEQYDEMLHADTGSHETHKTSVNAEDSAYCTKPSGQYTYQTYREGTFVWARSVQIKKTIANAITVPWNYSVCKLGCPNSLYLSVKVPSFMVRMGRNPFSFHFL